MVRVGPYTFEHEESFRGANAYEAWNDVPESEQVEDPRHEVEWSDTGQIVRWYFERGPDEPPTLMIIHEAWYSPGPMSLPLPDGRTVEFTVPGAS